MKLVEVFKYAKINQKGLHQMMDDEDVDIRIKVAERINQKGLHQMMNDEDEDVRCKVTERLDQLKKGG